VKCTAIKANGEKCLVAAIPQTDPPVCFFHLQNSDDEHQLQRLHPPLTKAQTISILTREIKRLSRKGGQTKTILACLEKIEVLKKESLAERLEAAKCQQ
jgi:hypothetical protein